MTKVSKSQEGKMKKIKKSELRQIIKEENDKIQKTKTKIKESFQELDSLVGEFKKELEFCAICEEQTQKVMDRIINE